MAQTKKTSQEILNSAQLELKCLQKPTCVLFLRGQKFRPYEKQWIDKLLQEHRTLQFAWMDSTIVKLSIESMLPDFVAGEHRMVLFRRQRDPGGAKHKGVVTAKAYRSIFDAMPVSMFLKEHVGTELKALSKAPTVSRRKSAPANAKSDDAGADTARRSEGRRSKRPQRTQKAQEEEKGDEYYFPRGVDLSDADEGSVNTRHADEEEEVLDLDEE